MNMRLMKNMNINIHKFEDICLDYVIDDNIIKNTLINNNIECVHTSDINNDIQMNKIINNNNNKKNNNNNMKNNNNNNNKNNNNKNNNLHNTTNEYSDVYELGKSKDRLFDMIYILKNGYDMYDFSKNKNE